jgi:hypothetical protein
MSDLNVVMREQALFGLQAQLDKAVTDGDTAAARKLADDLAKLAVSTAPKAPPFTGKDVYAVLDSKAPWYGIDPKKSAKAEELGKSMMMAKFPSAEAFADALIKAVDEEFKPASGRTVAEGDDDGEGGAADEDEGDDDVKPAAGEKKPRKTDGPREGDDTQRTVVRRTTGPWTKLADAPADIQKEVKRQTDKLVSASAPKEQREKFIRGALDAHYAAHVRAKGKK